MSELKPCPFSPEEIADILETLIPEIEDCMVVYAYQRSALLGAVAELRRTQPANEPLTLDELRGMDGEPVWVVFDDDSAMWALVDDGHVAEELKLTTNWGGQIVLAEHEAHIKEIYRRKPEGSENHV